MISLYDNRIKYWLQARTQEQRWMVVLAWFIISLGIWYFFWESDYQTNHAALNAQIIPLEQKIAAMQTQNDHLQKMFTDPVIRQQHQQLLRQLKDIDAQLKAVSTHLVSSENMAKALQNVVAESPGLTFVSFDNTGNKLLPTPDKSSTKLFSHDFTVVLEGDYFSTLNYLKSLEQLPWQFYWDSADYKVTTYPKAKITLRLHIVNTEEALI